MGLVKLYSLNEASWVKHSLDNTSISRAPLRPTDEKSTNPSKTHTSSNSILNDDFMSFWGKFFNTKKMRLSDQP